MTPFFEVHARFLWLVIGVEKTLSKSASNAWITWDWEAGMIFEMRTPFNSCIFMHIHPLIVDLPQLLFPEATRQLLSVLMKHPGLHQDHFNLLKSHETSMKKPINHPSKSHELQVYSMRAKLPSEPGGSEDMRAGKEHGKWGICWGGWRSQRLGYEYYSIKTSLVGKDVQFFFPGIC